MRMIDYLVLGTFTITSVLLFIILLLVIGYLIGHATRRKIQYKNFYSKIKYFNVSIPSLIFFLFLFFIVLSGLGIAFLVLSGYKEYEDYILSQGISLIIGVMLYQIFHLLEHFNEDMSVYKNNYTEVQTSFEIRDKAKHSIEQTIEYRKEVDELITNFESQIKEVDSPQNYNLRESLHIIDDFVTNQNQKIEEYSVQLIENFNLGLQTYLHTKEVIPLQQPSLRLDFQNKYDNIRNDIYESYNKIFNDTLYRLIQNKKYNTSTHITRGLQTLKDNKYTPTRELIELIIQTIEDIKGSPLDLVDYLLKNEIISLDELITYAISTNQAWVFKLDLFDTQDKLMTISERLIKEDAHYLALAFITKYFGSLQYVLAFTNKIKEYNTTLTLFNNYKKVMKYDSHFYSEHKEYENKAVAIHHFYKNKRVSTKLSQDINKTKNILEAFQNKDLLNKLYNYTQDKYDDLRVTSVKAMLLYIDQFDDGGLFKTEELSKKVNDYYERLLFNELAIITIILYALFIQENNEPVLYKEITEELRKTELIKDIVLLSILSEDPSTHKQVGKSIINTLLRTKEKEIANIILTIEKERCTIDKLS